MSKYDFPIEKIDLSTAHGKVLSRVKPGSYVLECGCASGYMTRYMAEEMGCQVAVVEKDAGDYQNAMRYAVRGYNQDLDEYTFYAHPYRYDYVLFADVLEHLRNPGEVLKRTAGLLEDDGRVLVSIPNICHNDIIIRMAMGHFDYTAYGLLDDGHIHFWGPENAEGFFLSAGLQIADQDAVIIATGCTEQFRYGQRPMTEDERKLAYLLKGRPHGTDYQLIYELKKVSGFHGGGAPC